jgi:hypothetical protein
MDEGQDFRYVPKRKLSEAEKQIIMLKIEKVKLQREKNILILNKSTMLFFAFFAVAVVGLVNKLISTTQLNFLIAFGVAALVVGVLPYSISARKEEKELEKTIDELTN